MTNIIINNTIKRTLICAEIFDHLIKKSF